MNYLKQAMNYFSRVLLDRSLNTYLTSLKNSLIKGLCCFLVVLGLILLLSTQVSLVYSQSNSLPYHLFLNLKHLTPNKGQYTCFHSPWYGGQVIKKVISTEGDILTYDKDGNLWLVIFERESKFQVKRLKIGKHKEFAKDGRKLTPIKSGFIPKGKVFVLGEHERSFDSRYQELGLILTKDLRGRLIALF